MGSIKTTQIDGDVSVGRHITSGGNADIAGSTHIGHDLVVDGWFEAPNIRGANKGFFLDEAKLQEAYPKPQKGWWAVVGDSIPGPIYVVEKGKWKNSGKTGGASHVYLTDIEKKLSDQANRNTNTDKRLSDLEGKVLSGLARHMVKMSEVGKLGCGINSQSGLEVATHAMMYTTLKVCKDDLIVVDAPQGLVVSAVLKNAAGELREVFATRAKDTLSQMLPSSAVLVPISEDCTMYLNLATNDDRPATKADFEATKVYIYQKNITDSAYSGKNVVWIGTSIPAGEGERKYPEILSRRLGFNLKNKAIGASYFSKASISSDANAPVTCLSMTKAEMTAKWGAKAQLFASFEEVFKAIDANTDIVVFDHGYNDRDAITAVMKAGGFEADLKGTPQGEIQKQIKDDIALLVREIKSRAPRVKIVVCGYFTKHHDAWVGDNSLSGTQYVSTKYICDWAAELAESLSVECWPVWQLLDVHDAKYEPMSGVVFRDFCPDDVHPHSEASGKSIRLYADAVERAMLGGAIDAINSVAIKELQKKTAVLDGLRQDVNNITSEVKTKAAAADVKNQITSLNAHLQNLEEELDTLTSEVGTKAQDEEMQRKILELRSLLQSLQNDVNSKISSIRFDPNDDMVVASIHTLLDSGVPFPAATQEKAGVMTAADKKELAKVQTIIQQLGQMGEKLGMLHHLGTFDTQGAARQAAASNHVVYDLENVRFLTYTKQSASGNPNQGFILQTVNKERSMTHQLEFFMGHLSQRDISWNQNSGAVNAFKWEEIGALKFSTEEREEKTWLVVKNYENSLVARVALPDALELPELNFPDKPLDTLLREILDAHGAGFACNILCKAPRVEDFFDEFDFVFVGYAEVTEWRNYSYKNPQQQLRDVRNRMVRVDGVISFYRYKGQTSSDPSEIAISVRWAASYEKMQVKDSTNYTIYSKLFPVVAPTRFENE